MNPLLKPLRNGSATALGIILLLAVAAIAGDRGATPSPEDVASGLRPLVLVTNRPLPGFSLPERMAHYNVPGVGIALIHGGEVAWSVGYGTADAATGESADAATLFRACSISKPVSAAGALELVARGVLDLDAPASRYLRSWRLPDSPFTAKRSITLRHLLSHSAGLSNDPDLSFVAGGEVPTLTQILDGEAPARSAPARIDTLPGVLSRYSNQGYGVVQLMMTDATGRPFADLMDDLVLEPAGMSGSTFRQEISGPFLSRAAAGHLTTGEPLPGEHWVTPAQAAAGMWTTPEDLARFAVAVMNSAAGEAGALLDRGLASAMLTAQLGERGLGFSVEGEGEDLRFSHGGASEGFRCYMMAYPARGEGVVIMTNGEAGQGVYYEVLRGLAATLDWPGNRSVEKTIVPIHDGFMAECAGTYRFSGRLELKIEPDGDHLRMATPGNAFSLYPEGDTIFFDIDYGFTLDFKRDESGTVSTAIMNRGGVLSTLERTR